MIYRGIYVYIYLPKYTHLMKIYNLIFVLEVVPNNGALFVDVVFFW